MSTLCSDPDGDPLTYTWEQFDLGAAAALDAEDDGQIPLFRSFPPVPSPSRTFPAFADLLAGPGSLFPDKLGEQLPSTDRTLTFRATARDNRAGGAGADDDDMTITVLGAPFAITAPTVGGGLECNAPSDIFWNVGGGAVAPTVNVLLSTNGGASFPTMLAANTANDGSLTVNGPDTLTNDARLRIDAVGNIFFALSEQIAIQDTLDPDVTCPAPVVVECTGNNGIAKNDPQLAAVPTRWPMPAAVRQCRCLRAGMRARDIDENVRRNVSHSFACWQGCQGCMRDPDGRMNREPAA